MWYPKDPPIVPYPWQLWNVLTPKRLWLVRIFLIEWQPDLYDYSVKKSPHKSNSFRREIISKIVPIKPITHLVRKQNRCLIKIFKKDRCSQSSIQRNMQFWLPTAMGVLEKKVFKSVDKNRSWTISYTFFSPFLLLLFLSFHLILIKDLSYYFRYRLEK